MSMVESRGALRVLLLEADADAAAQIESALRVDQDARFELTRVGTESTFRDALAQPWDVVLADYRAQEFSAPHALAVLRELGMDLPCIVISETIGDEAAADVIRAGAAYFVAKDRLGRLPHVLDHSVREAREKGRRMAAEVELRESRHLSDLLCVHLGELDRRRCGAMDLNDDAIQRLVVAQAALRLGDPVRAAAALDEALSGVQHVMEGLLPDAPPEPGAYRRGQSGGRGGAVAR
jgi:DNA-binding NarL/FixJ family response regulator